MPEVADPPAKPLRTWRPMAAWSLTILAALGLLGGAGGAYRHFLTEPDRLLAHWNAPPGLPIPDNVDAVDVIRQMGGPERAVSRLNVYLLFPERWTNKWGRPRVPILLAYCGAPARPLLARLLADPDKDMRKYAAAALCRIGPGTETVPALAKALHDPDPAVRNTAAIALIHAGPDAEPALSDLLLATTDSDRCVHCNSADALGQIGPKAARAVPTLVAMLDTDEDSTARRNAAKALGMIRSDLAATIPALEKALADDSFEVRCAAADALKRIRDEWTGKPALSGEIARMRIVELILQLDAQNEDVSNRAIEELSKMGSAAAEAAPALVMVVLREGPQRRGKLIADALVKMDPGLKTTLPLLERKISAEGADAIGAVELLGILGPPAKTTVPVLAKVLASGRHDRDRRLAAEALGRIGAVEAVQALVKSIETESYSECVLASARSLARIDRTSMLAISALTRLLANENPWLRCRAAGALGEIGPAATSAIPALEKAAGEDKDKEVRLAAAEALKKIRGKETPK